MTFTLGPKSQAELRGVHPRLAACVHRALHYTPVDFGVHDGLRTEAEQREYVARGVSRTMNSMHRIQADGYGHAVDLVPYINGKLRWEWPPLYAIAAAMHRAAREEGVALRWGGVWDRRFPIDFGNTPAAIKRAVDEYVGRRRALGKSAFLDGPHFELARGS
jgi:peptidoglycan L-alanyl-D-glutamate endopeptidase CwlK